MKLLAAKFTKRYNIGDYNHEEYTLEAEIEDGETGSGVLGALRDQVVAAFSDEATDTEKETTETKPAKGGKAKKAKKGKANAPTDETDHTDDENSDDEDSEIEDAGPDDESDSDDEATDTEDGDDGDDSSDDDEESADDEKPVKGKKDASAASSKGKNTGKSFEKETGKKTFRKKPQSYNRAIEQHKEIFSGVLRSVAPDWKKNEASKKKAKLTSEKMEGTEFLDENGEVLQSFKVAVKKSMAGK